MKHKTKINCNVKDNFIYLFNSNSMVSTLFFNVRVSMATSMSLECPKLPVSSTSSYFRSTNISQVNFVCLHAYSKITINEQNVVQHI